jgi:hypothetical protein
VPIGRPRSAASRRRSRRTRLGDAEVEHLRHGAPVDLGDEHVGGLEVAVDHAALVRVLHGVGDVEQQPHARSERERRRSQWRVIGSPSTKFITR